MVPADPAGEELAVTAGNVEEPPMIGSWRATKMLPSAGCDRHLCGLTVSRTCGLH